MFTRPCFCGKNESEYHVKIEIDSESKYIDIDRCRLCSERAKRSYDDITITRLDGESDDLTS